MSRFLFWVPKGPSLRLTPEKGGHGRCFHRSASAAQGNPDTRGGAGSRGTRQLGPKGSGLEGSNDRLRDQVKKKGWWLWFYETREPVQKPCPIAAACPRQPETPQQAVSAFPNLDYRPQRSDGNAHGNRHNGRLTHGTPQAHPSPASWDWRAPFRTPHRMRRWCAVTRSAP